MFISKTRFAFCAMVVVLVFSLLLEIQYSRKFKVNINEQIVRNILTPFKIRFIERSLSPPTPSIAKKEKHRILVFIGIGSAPVRKNRRDAVRKTWFTRCDNQSAVCLFFTDGQDWFGETLNENITKPLREESAANGYDMVLADSPGGVNFALRYLFMAEFAIKHFQFDFFLHVDDDHFLCIDRLLWELPQRPQRRLVWGWQHCRKNAVRIDAGWHLTSADVIEEFLYKVNTSLVCHPFADEAISIWFNSMEGMIYFADNRRIYHGVSARDQSFKNRSEICRSYLSLHGSYPDEMLAYWKIVSGESTGDFDLSPVVDECNFPKFFDYNSMSGFYFAEPKPCKGKPTWQKRKLYIGRGGL